MLLAATIVFAAINLAIPSEQARDFRPKPHLYELMSRFYSPIGWQRCHCFSFPCNEATFERIQDSFFGKVNEKEIKFPEGLCHIRTLLCVEVSFDEKKQAVTIVLAENENNEEWPDDLVRILQPKMPIGHIEIPLDEQCVYGEWDELRSWQTDDEEKKKADFLGLISAHNR